MQRDRTPFPTDQLLVQGTAVEVGYPTYSAANVPMPVQVTLEQGARCLSVLTPQTLDGCFAYLFGTHGFVSQWPYLHFGHFLNILGWQ